MDVLPQASNAGSSHDADVPDQPVAVVGDIFSTKFRTRHERFPQLHGRVLREHVDNLYVLGEETHLPLFSPDGSRVFKRHNMNELRANRTVIE